MGKKAREKRLREPTAKPAQSGSQPLVAVAELPWSDTPQPAAPGNGTASDVSIAAGLFILALLVRAALLYQLAGTPYTQVENIDTKGYVDWAKQILGGAWLPGRHFYQSPLYAYYLATIYAVTGVGHWVPRCLQAIVGAGSVVLLYAIAQRAFSRRVGVIAALMLCFYGPLIAEEIMLAKTALVIAGTLLSVYLYLRALQETNQRLMLFAGLAFGVTIIAVGQWFPVLLALAAYLALTERRRWRQRRVLLAALLAGTAVFMVPIVAWNSYWGGGLMLTSGDAGLNLFVGNNPLATGLPGRPNNLRDIPQFEEEDSKRLAEKEVGHPLTPAQVSQHWSRRATTWALSNPGSFLSTLFQKTIVFWNSFEVPDSYQFNFMRAYFLPWLWATLTFAIVGPLALTGLLLVLGHRPAHPLYIACLTYVAVIIGFYVRSRYRLPAIPLLIVFAAAAIDWLLVAAQRRQWQSLAAGAVALIATGALVNHQYCEPGRDGAPSICLSGDAWFDLEWMKLAEWRDSLNDLEGTAAYLHQATAGQSLRGPGPLHFWLGYVEFRLGEKLKGAADPTATQHLDIAVQEYQRALSYNYRPTATYSNLALTYRTKGQGDQAVAAIEKAARLSPTDPDIILRAVRYRAENGNCAEAEQWRATYERLRPGDPAAQNSVATCVPAQH